MTSPQPKAHEPLRDLTSTQRRYIANAVLYALRRGANRSVPGSENRFEIIGANSIPNGYPPLPHTQWWTGAMPSHPHIGLPDVGLLITDTTFTDAKYETEARAWDDLHRITHQTRIDTLFIVSHHVRTGWYAQRNPRVGRAGDAALTILELARVAGHIVTKGNRDG